MHKQIKVPASPTGKLKNQLPSASSKFEWKALLILITSLLLTAATIWNTHRNAEVMANKEFYEVCNEIAIKIDTRLHAHALLLRSGSAFFDGSDTITRTEWKDFVENLIIEKNVPGILGVGFATIIPKNQLQQHIQRIRHEGFPDFSIKPAGQREIYTSILYLEPFTGRNLRAFGYDMFSEPVRRHAMEQSRDNDVAMLSGKVLLVQETDEDVQPGNLMYVPVYRKGMPAYTVEQRRAAIVGWVYSPYRMNDLMQEILGRWDRFNDLRIRLQIYDDSVSATSLLYDSQSNDSQINNHPTSQTITLPVDFNGTKWTLCFSRHEEHLLFFNNNDIIVFIVGILISFLLFGLFLSLIKTEKRAIQIAEKLTSELRESEARFKNMFKYHNAIMLLIEVDSGQIIDANQAAADFYGYSVSKLVTLTINDLNILDTEETKEIRKQIANNEKLHFNFTHKLANGELRTVETHSSQISFESKNAIFAIMHDITDRKRAEDELRIKEERYRLLAQNTRDVVYTMNLDGTITFVSPAVELLRGLTVEEAMNQPLDKILTPDSQAISIGYVQKLYAAFVSGLPLPDFHGELEYYRKDGSTLMTESFCYPVLENDGSSVSMIGVTRDITERKKAEQEIKLKNEELHEINATKDKFFNIIAHDLKNPFNTIMGFSEILVEQVKEKDYDGIDKYAGFILQSSRHALVLLMNLMDWARSQTGRMEFIPEHFEMVELINEVKQLSDDTARQKTITISRDIPHNAIVFADKAMISTVLRNLVSNAIKFTKLGGEINISAKETPDELIISVADNGVGISKDRIEKIFRLDKSYSTSGTNNEKGTGLGLIICKEFVEKHGGKIWIESEEDEGSRFSFTIPDRV